MLVGQPARPVTLEWERALKEWVGGDPGVGTCSERVGWW